MTLQGNKPSSIISFFLSKIEFGRVEGMIVNSGHKIPRKRAEKDERDTCLEPKMTLAAERNEAPPIAFGK